MDDQTTPGWPGAAMKTFNGHFGVLPATLSDTLHRSDLMYVFEAVCALLCSIRWTMAAVFQSVGWKFRRAFRELARYAACLKSWSVTDGPVKLYFEAIVSRAWRSSMFRRHRCWVLHSQHWSRRVIVFLLWSVPGSQVVDFLNGF
jgi:hypothetical protein